jgi:hypothetical protein
MLLINCAKMQSRLLRLLLLEVRELFRQAGFQPAALVICELQNLYLLSSMSVEKMCVCFIVFVLNIMPMFLL